MRNSRYAEVGWRSGTENAEAACVEDFICLKSPAAAVVRTLQKNQFAVTSLDSDDALDKRVAPSRSRDIALALCLQRQDFSGAELNLGGRSIPVVPFPSGAMSLVNLALDRTVYRKSNPSFINFYLRRDTFDRLADDHGATRIASLAIEPGIAADDPIVANLGACLLAANERPDKFNPLFLDHVAKALHTHLAQRYGGMQMPQASIKGGLAPWQLRLARSLIAEHVGEKISLSQIANACELSASHFARAFIRSTGVPFHQWLMDRRVDHAKDLMRTSSIPLAAIALQCGFSEQSHFTRVFSRAAGATPAKWRKDKLAYVAQQ
jgi:AraC family transcriptional regulator